MGSDQNYDPANIVHESYSIGASAGPTYIEGSVENNKGEIDYSANAGLSISASTPGNAYYEQGYSKEYNYSKDGLEKSDSYFKSTGVSLGSKKFCSFYAEKTRYVDPNDVREYNKKVQEFKKIEANPLYRHSRAIREEVNREYSSVLHPHDYNVEFGISENENKTNGSSIGGSFEEREKNRMDSFF